MAAERALDGSSTGATKRIKETAHVSLQQRPDVKAERETYFDSQPDLDLQHLIFVDESAFSTKMARLRGCGSAPTRLAALKGEGQPHPTA